MNIEEKEVINPRLVQMSKTFSLTMDHVNKVKELAEFMSADSGEVWTEARVMKKAIDNLYAVVFPKSGE